MTGLCDALGTGMTAEGVDTHDQLSMLHNEGLTEVKGYLFRRPRPTGDVSAIIANVQNIAREASASVCKPLMAVPALHIVAVYDRQAAIVGVSSSSG